MKLLSLWVHIIICLVQYQIGFPHLCHEEERELLLQLKLQLVPPPDELLRPYNSLCDGRPGNHSKVMHWKHRRDCCLWDGVTCDDSTGHVIGLDLSCSALTGTIHSNSTLFRLTHLQNLNLALNDFDGTNLSFKFGQLNSLTHLNLSHSGFGGHIPFEFYHLTNLVSLDITSHLVSFDVESDDYYTTILNCDHINTLFGNMTKLSVLLLGWVNISSEIPNNVSSFLTRLDLGNTGVHGNLPVSIFEKPNLQYLNLGGNDGLTGFLPSFNQSSVRLIEELGLWGTSISGRLPDSISSMTNLNSLNLSHSKFSGPIPESIGNLTQLAEMDLSRNEFSGQVPSTIANLRQLTHLHLSENHLKGQLPDAFSDLQKLTSLRLFGNGFSGIMPPSLFANMSQLKELNISSNALTGQLPSSLANMSQLQKMDISSNRLTGPFPSRAGNGLRNLSVLYLSSNSIQGTVPSWLFRLPSLRLLDLSFNKLIIELESFPSQIQQVSLSHNTITQQSHNVYSNLSLPNLELFELSSCEIKEFPKLLRNASSLTWLGLSNNKIHGQIPSWFGSLPLTYLNLSVNYLTQAPWNQLGNLNVLDLHSNSLQDTFPSSICNMTELHIMDLSSNKLRGTIPECIGSFSDELKVIDLRRNKLHGKIPTSFGQAGNSLVTLALNGNRLEGRLPRSLSSCHYLEVLDVGNNMIQDTFPSWLEGTDLIILILKSNRFHGPISPPHANKSFIHLKIVDLSYNNFSGTLPEKFFTTLQAMKKHDEVSMDGLYLETDSYDSSMTLLVKRVIVEFTRVLRSFTTIDLSSNNFHGHIPESLTDLIVLRLLNLSHNCFNGSIPPALGSMTKLEQLDLSSNQLRGGIPQTLTNLTFLAVFNLSHNHLVGPIPKGNQFQTFSNESYIGNPGLCGDPLTTSCGVGREPPSPVVFEEKEDEEDGFMMGFTWKTVVIGYACGIVGGFILGNLMISAQKPKWLTRFVYTEAAIILKRRKRRAVRMVLLGTR